ncbi:GGDEF domain-containing response regulator [Arenimonas oryziterrae]|uniref:Response regulatory domain-containing protein n=1 Tax=Arenimonas oryziterrae DSM 21050 = YC6267 TaxID=1121015 RepID=A0A091APG5_9GAMM|nr:response regulator [Arenimonas oryziterrae]KFN41012.1 hypothetical protein N789_03780 [Arenimonas oryziterrae DSM 21050 = YC6267]
MSDEASTKTRVLVVDDSKLMQKAAMKMLGGEFDIVIANDGLEAWAQLEADDSIQVVFTDLTMPRCDGYELLRMIRAAGDTGLSHLPVIVVTGAENDESARLQALNGGATDFITKPFTSVDLLARARAHANYQRITKQLQAQTTLDALTGLANKSGFLERLQQDIAYARRHDHLLTLVCLEIDGFRDIFLKRGKTVAEPLAVHVARLLRERIRKEDTAGRIGLGGFALSLPAGKPDGIEGMVERLCAEIAAHPPEVDGEIVPITVSAAVYSPEVHLGPTAPEALERCQTQLEARRAGKVAQTTEKAPVKVPVKAPEPAAPVAAKAVETPAAAPAPPAAEPVALDPLLEQVRLGNKQPALEKMPQILNRLLPIFRLLSANQRAQLIQFLQQLSG